jgi:uncharacterized membrane protein YdbT with pleckstrin-like domain
MPTVHYEASPSLVRTNPLGTMLMILLMFAGVYLAIAGDQVAALIGLPEDNRKIIGLVGIVLLAIGFLRLLIWWVATKIDHLKVTDDEIIWTHGLLNKQYTEINMSSVRTVRVAQSLFQRIMNAGDVTIYTSGDEPELSVRGLPDPDQVRRNVKGERTQED